MNSAPLDEWTNARLVEECSHGSEQAWSVLVGRYKRLLHSIALHFGAPPQDAADIFQTVCLDLYKDLPRLRNSESLPGWLIRVTAHKCHHWRRRQDLSAEDCEYGFEIASGAELPTELLMRLERDQQLHDAIAELPPRCQEMIRLLFLQEPTLSYAEVARRLRLARGSIGFIRGRCLQRLRKILEEKGF
jgi:RNA polymerase sigma factor (sigma-70 family)